MKTTNILTLVAAIIFLALRSQALSPASTATFVNPCQPFGIINPVANTYGCFSFSATNAGASDPAGFYSWTFGDGASATGTNVLHCYSPCTVSTVYTVVLSYNSAALCGPAPTQQSYTLQLNPPAQVLCVRNTPSVTLAANTVTVWGGVVIPETMYSYKYGDNSPAVNSMTYTYASCGNYIIEVQSWDMNMPQFVCHSYAAVNIACPNSTTGINEYGRQTGSVNIFPNPVSRELTIVSEKEINGIKVVDLLGRECLRETVLNSSKTTLPVSDLQPGTYFITLVFADGSGNTMRFIKN